MTIEYNLCLALQADIIFLVQELFIWLIIYMRHYTGFWK